MHAQGWCTFFFLIAVYVSTSLFNHANDRFIRVNMSMNLLFFMTQYQLAALNFINVLSLFVSLHVSLRRNNKDSDRGVRAAPQWIPAEAEI